MKTSIQDLCAQGLSETPLWQHMHQLLEAQNIVHTGLPVDYREAVRVANIRDQCLILAVAHSALATKIRFLSPTLLVHCRRKGLIIKRIRCQLSAILGTQGR